MTYETKQIADELCKKIEETKECINSLQYRISNAEREREGKAEVNVKRKQPFMIRLLNRSKQEAEAEQKKQGAEIIVFDNIFPYGTDIEADEEVISAILSVYQNRLKILEKEFFELKG